MAGWLWRLTKRRGYGVKATGLRLAGRVAAAILLQIKPYEAGETVSYSTVAQPGHAILPATGGVWLKRRIPSEENSAI